MNFENFIVEKKCGIARIVFNRPQIMNALDLNGVEELAAALDAVENDDEVKVVILTGTGRAFCAGGNLNFFLKLYDEGIEAIRHFIVQTNKIVDKIVTMKKFLISSVNGDAMGGGFSFVLASDMVIASEKARFGLTFMKIGLVPDTGANYTLPRLIGPLKAKELFVTGDIISAAEAFKLNLVNKIVPADQLEIVTSEMAVRLSGNSGLAMGLVKELVNKSLAADGIRTVMEYETEYQTDCLHSKEANALIQKFINPSFRQ